MSADFIAPPNSKTPLSPHNTSQTSPHAPPHPPQPLLSLSSLVSLFHDAASPDFAGCLRCPSQPITSPIIASLSFLMPSAFPRIFSFLLLLLLLQHRLTISDPQPLLTNLSLPLLMPTTLKNSWSPNDTRPEENEEWTFLNSSSGCSIWVIWPQNIFQQHPIFLLMLHAYPCVAASDFASEWRFTISYPGTPAQPEHNPGQPSTTPIKPSLPLC